MTNPSSYYGGIRTALGCNQEQLAIYLGISRSHLAMVEKRRRFLLGNAQTRLLKIYQPVLQTLPAIDSEPLPATTPEIEDYKRMMERDIIRQRKKVAAITAKRQEALNSLEHAAVLKKLSPDTDLEYHQFLRMVEAEARVKLSAAKVDTIALEQLKLKALEAAWQAVTA